MQKAKRVLEIGMYTGYSALASAEALPEDGEVVTCEVDPYLEEFAKRSFARSPHGKKIKIRLGTRNMLFIIYYCFPQVHMAVKLVLFVSQNFKYFESFEY